MRSGLFHISCSKLLLLCACGGNRYFLFGSKGSDRIMNSSRDVQIRRLSIKLDPW